MTRLVLAFILTLAFQTIYADVLLIEEVRQSERLELPKNGQDKGTVEAKFGKPVEKLAAVGEPPITSWQYDTFNVYFEHDLVLFAVLHPGAVIEK